MTNNKLVEKTTNYEHDRWQYLILNKTKNPYVFKVNRKLIRMSFSENGPTADDCLTRVLENLYR